MGIARLLLVLVISVAVLSACGGDSGDSGDAGDTTTTATSEDATDAVGGDTITIEDLSFGAPLTVAPGTTVTVKNDDSAPHTWTSDDGVWDSGDLSPGDTFELAFDEAGEFPFHCEIHPSMTGQVTVSG